MAASDEMLTKAPPPTSIMCGTANLADRHTAVELVSKVRCQPSSVMPSTGPISGPVALLTTTSTRPYTSIASVTICLQPSSVPTSVTQTWTSPPVCATSLATVSALAATTSTTTTRAPSAAKRRTMAPPMPPPPPPVTITVRPANPRPASSLAMGSNLLGLGDPLEGCQRCGYPGACGLHPVGDLVRGVVAEALLEHLQSG